MSLYIYWPLSHIAPGTEFTVKLQTSHMYFLWKERLFLVWILWKCEIQQPCLYISVCQKDHRNIFTNRNVILEKFKSVICPEYYYQWLVKSITICDWSWVLLSMINQEYYSLGLVKSIARWDWSRVLLSVNGQRY